MKGTEPFAETKFIKDYCYIQSQTMRVIKEYISQTTWMGEKLLMRPLGNGTVKKYAVVEPIDKYMTDELSELDFYRFRNFTMNTGRKMELMIVIIYNDYYRLSVGLLSS